MIDIRQCQKGDIIAYKRFKDHPGGQFANDVIFGVFQELSTRDVKGYDAKEWIEIVNENSENRCIIPSQVVNVFKDVIG